MRLGRLRMGLTATGFTILVFWITTHKKHEESTPNEAIRNGDILLFEGCSFRSDFVRILQLNKSRFSHVGIAFLEDSEIYVIHADPNLGCTKERLNSLFEEHHATAVVAYRPAVNLSQSANAVRIAQTYADRHVPFDTDFDSLDATRLYCSELVCRAYQGAGVELVPLQDHVIYPEEFAAMQLLCRVPNEDDPNKTVVATADNVPRSLRSGRPASAVPHL